MTYEDFITEATKKAMSVGNRVFQIFQFGNTEASHCQKLLEWMNPKTDAKILDVGCGVGEVARIMKSLSPGLSFTLLCNNIFQLSHCPEYMPQIYGDMHDVPLPDSSFDAVMVNYVIGYADLSKAFSEFNRLLKPDGVLFICDLTGRSELFRNVFSYVTQTPGELILDAEKQGFSLGLFVYPEDIYLSHFDRVLNLEAPETEKICRQALADVRPAVWRFRKDNIAPQKTWGIASSIDVHNCNPEKIRDAKAIKSFAIELCDLIEMKNFGETIVVRFGSDPEVTGYSMVQLIETSLISAHFAEKTNTAYIDVFSCKHYNLDTVRRFSEKYFEGTHSYIGTRNRI